MTFLNLLLKKSLIFFIGLGLLGLFPAKIIAQDTGWVIEDFNADIHINTDTSVDITETIQVDFGNLDKHGIFRYIPVKYKTKLGNTLNIKFKLVNITDASGKNYQVATSYESDNVKLKIGDPDSTLSGPQIYIIRYRVNQVITTPNQNAEFYWNVTGTGWPVPITHSSATITAPDNSLLDEICFTGYFGSTFSDCISAHELNTAKFSADDLGANAGLTIAVALDKSAFIFPPLTTKLWWLIKDNWLYLLPLFTFILMLRWYWIRGRDKQYRHLFSATNGVEPVPLFEKMSVMNIYGPPKDLSPGEVGVLVDEKVHMQDITATIIDLARRGYFSITDVPAKGLFGKPDYELALADKDESELKPYEEEVMDMLFGASREEKIKLSKPASSAYQHLNQARKKLYDHITKLGYFNGNPDSVRLKFVGLAIGLGLFSLFLVSPILASAGLGFSAYFGLVGSALVILSFAPFMPARSAEGRKKLKEIAGLREWIRLGAWREKIHEKHNFFEEVLPFAIAFGLTEKFIQAFKDADIKDLSWYRSTGSFNGSNFTRSLNTFNHSVGSGVASTRPKSSSWSSGGSGFSGGSSGGGGGGGGGGSW